MLNTIFTGTTATTTFDITQFLICTGASVLLGIIIMLFYSYKNSASKNFMMTLVLMPVIVQGIIMVVNGNIGTGVAVAGAFSLVRFRSVPGNARDICSIFLAMAVGLATGTGYIGIAAAMVIIVGILSVLFTVIGLGEPDAEEKQLIVTIPESLDYTGVFDDLFEKYTQKSELVRVRTTNMGSLYKLTYDITLKSIAEEKALLDDIRCRNGNLDIICGKVPTEKKESL